MMFFLKKIPKFTNLICGIGSSEIGLLSLELSLLGVMLKLLEFHLRFSQE
jgi:hypothetical protein